jgi:hypothetical protein
MQFLKKTAADGKRPAKASHRPAFTFRAEMKGTKRGDPPSWPSDLVAADPFKEHHAALSCDRPAASVAGRAPQYHTCWHSGLSFFAAIKIA